DQETSFPRALSAQRLSPRWCFLDATSADRFYRIDRSQEHLHFVMEISHDEIFILDPDMVVSQQAGTPPGMPDLVVEQASGLSIWGLEILTLPSVHLYGLYLFSLKTLGYDLTLLKMGIALIVKAPGFWKDMNDRIIQKWKPEHVTFKHVFGIYFRRQSLQKIMNVSIPVKVQSLFHFMTVGHEIQPLLIESYKNGGSLLIQGPDHCSLLHYAAKTGNGEIVKYILDHGPAELLDMADSETGETALHKAACQRNRAVCQLLVDAGASLRQTDSKGKTPQERAQQAGDPDLAAYLESRQNYKIIGHEDLETAV
ncbi:hypothetical protein STEG23_017409, partial [Scotinomys teguina]